MVGTSLQMKTLVSRSAVEQEVQCLHKWGEFTFPECETSVGEYGWAVTVFETVEEEGKNKYWRKSQQKTRVTCHEIIVSIWFLSSFMIGWWKYSDFQSKWAKFCLVNQKTMFILSENWLKKMCWFQIQVVFTLDQILIYKKKTMTSFYGHNQAVDQSDVFSL